MNRIHKYKIAGLIFPSLKVKIQLTLPTHNTTTQQAMEAYKHSEIEMNFTLSVN